MTFLLPLVALALAFAAPFLFRAERAEPARREPLRLGVLTLLTIAGAVLVSRSAPAVDRVPALIGLALGAGACALGAWTGGIGAGVAAAAALHLLPATSLPTAGLALVAGTGLGALTVGGETAALAAVLTAAADNLGMRHSPVPAAAFVGSQLGVAATVGAFLAAWTPARLGLLRPVVVGLLLLGAGSFLANALNERPLVLCVGMGAAAGVVLHWLMPEEEGESSRVGLATVVGIGLATVAFGLGRGLGMALAALAAGAILLAVENRRAVLALGPLVGLVLYRTLREAGTGATRAIDIAQHYTLLALCLGLVLPLLPTDWLRARHRVPRAIGAGLWGLGAIAAAPLVVVALGMRGGVGFTVGLGVAGLAQALRGEERGSTRTPASLLPLALGSGLGGATILTLAWLGDESTITRDQKVHLFAYAGAGIAVLAVLIALVGRLKKEAEVL